MKAIPKAPRHLSAVSKTFWKSINQDYELESDALLILQAACENWDRAQQARTAVNREGITIDGRRNPAVDIEKQAYSLFLRAMRQLAIDVVAPGPVGRPAGR